MWNSKRQEGCAVGVTVIGAERIDKTGSNPALVCCIYIRTNAFGKDINPSLPLST